MQIQQEKQQYQAIMDNSTFYRGLRVVICPLTGRRKPRLLSYMYLSGVRISYIWHRDDDDNTGFVIEQHAEWHVVKHSPRYIPASIFVLNDTQSGRA